MQMTQLKQENKETPIVVAKMDDGKFYEMSKKAQWSMLRLQHKYKVGEQFKDLSKEKFADKFRDMIIPNELRKDLHYIMYDGRIHNVVTTQYNSISEEEVYDVLDKALDRHGINLIERDRTLGRIGYIQKTSVLNIGLQFMAGDTLTQHALKISNFTEILQCLNPISFLNLDRHIFDETVAMSYTLRRVDRKSILEKRIDAVISASKTNVDKMSKLFDHTKTIKLNENQASFVLATMGKQYGLGIKSLKASMQHFRETADKSVYGLSMATSYISQHEDKIKAENTRQALSTVSGALMLFPNKQKVFEAVDFGRRDKDINQLSIDIC